MCGINGFTFRDPSLLRRMHATTHHRGPDDAGFFEDDHISFAHNRLSIIDLSPGGHQPMSTPDGRYTIVFNGEIYNYQEIKRELEQLGEHFSSQSDTEVLLRAWSRWQEACLPRLNGIFAFAVWDRDEQKLCLVRDPLGVKPLSYRLEDGRMWFSSELKSLIHVGKGQPPLDEISLDIYLRLLYIPAPRSIFKNIFKLPAGHLLRWQQGHHEVIQWWSIKEGEPLQSYEQAQQSVRETMQAAITRQLISDRPVGVFLSGGLDSSIVLAGMRETVSGPINTFTVKYAAAIQPEKYNADADLARKTAAYFKTDHTEIAVTSEQVMECFDDVAWHMDEPIANHVQTVTYLLAKHASQRVTVALGGDGGDELFGGYARYWYQAQIELARRLGAAWPASLIEKVASGQLARFASLVQQPLNANRHLAFLLQKEQDVVRIRKSSSSDMSRRALHEIFDPLFAIPWRDRVNQSMAADSLTWLAEESFMRTDKMTMAHGLEERVPFLDLEVVNLASRIPSKWKIASREQGKRILLDAWRDALPPHLLAEEKRAFLSPAAKWLRGSLYSFVQERFRLAAHGPLSAYINFVTAEKLLQEHVEQKQYHLHLIWTLLSLQAWSESLKREKS